MERSRLDRVGGHGSTLYTPDATTSFTFLEKAKLDIVVPSGDVAKLYAIKSTLRQMGVEEFFESTMLCHGHQEGQTMSYRGVAYAANYVEKIRIEMFVAGNAVRPLIEAIGTIARSQHLTDWQLHVTPEVLLIDSGDVSHS